MKKILFATSNKGKIQEIEALLLGGPKFILPTNIDAQMPDEIGNTFDQNALIKSKVMFSKYGYPTLAEDSGLVVDALGGRPGIYSARYADDEESAYLKILQEMKGETNRTARFVCTVSFSWNGGDKHFRGTMEGGIAQKPQGENGFGYDPIFLYDGKHTTAQISRAEKNKISHRGIALRKFAKWFAENKDILLSD